MTPRAIVGGLLEFLKLPQTRANAIAELARFASSSVFLPSSRVLQSKEYPTNDSPAPAKLRHPCKLSRARARAYTPVDTGLDAGVSHERDDGEAGMSRTRRAATVRYPGVFYATSIRE